jgi:acetoin utilization protein AcuB
MQVVKDMMSDRLEVVGPEASLRDVLKTMNQTGYRHLPVVENTRLIGIITDRDIRLAVNSPVVEDSIFTSRENVLDELKVQECMTPDPQCVAPETLLKQVAETLALSKFGAMPVVDKDRLVGLISYIDFLKHYAAS